MTKDVRDAVVAKLGNLMLINLELATQNRMLAELVKAQQTELAAMKKSTPVENLPANPYEEVANGTQH